MVNGVQACMVNGVQACMVNGVQACMVNGVQACMVNRVQTCMVNGVQMGKGFLTYSSAIILQAVANGYLYGFDIIDVTGLPGGTVYPALRRLEETRYLISKWEKHVIAQGESRPPRKYYELTRAGQEVLAEAVKRYRLLEQSDLSQGGAPKPSKA